MGAREDGLARERVLAEIKADMAGDEVLLWVGIPRTSSIDTGLVGIGVGFAFVAIPALALGAATGRWQVWAAFACSLVGAVVFVVWSVTTKRPSPERRIVYAVSTERAMIRGADGFRSELPVRGLPVTYVKAGHFTTVSFAPPTIFRGSHGINPQPGSSFRNVVDDGGAMLTALEQAGTEVPRAGNSTW